MKHISVKRIVALLLVLCMLFAFAGCKKKTSTNGSSEYEYEYVYEYEEGDNNGTSDDAATGNGTNIGKNSNVKPTDQTVSNDQTKVSGKNVTISLGISSTERPEMDHILPIFKKKYPTITVEVHELASSLYAITSKWTSLAAAGKLQDVVIGSENFGYIMQQGWAYPLDNLLAADEHKNDVLTMGLDRYRYEGKLYALPFRLQFNTFYVNDDLLSTLNIKKPAYNWTISQFISLAKQATTNEYSGINYMINTGEPTYGVDNKLMSGALPDGYEQYGFNMKTGQFNLQANNAFVSSINWLKELRSVKGCVSDELKDYSLRNNGKTDDYDKKFGKDADAFVSGKVLFGNHNTWQYDWYKNTLKYNCDMYPIPTADNVTQRIQTHVDFVFMNSNCDQSNYLEAYALCRFLSYDTDGCIGRIDYMVNHSEQDKGAFTFYGPASASQQVLDNFNSYKVFPNGLKYMLKQIVKDPAHTLVADCNKVVPDFWQNVDQYRSKAQDQIDTGTAPEAIVGELQDHINEAMKSSLAYLSKKVKANQDKFYASHTYESR